MLTSKLGVGFKRPESGKKGSDSGMLIEELMVRPVTAHNYWGKRSWCNGPVGLDMIG